MDQPLQSLGEDLEALRAVWVGALPFGTADVAVAPAVGGSVGGVQVDVGRMSDSGLVRATDALARLVRNAEGVLARVAGEVARRSPAELGRDGLAKRQGFVNPARLVAAATGGSVVAASRLVAVGQATAIRQSLVGEVLPPAHPHVAAGLAAGAISVDAASAITSMLDRVAPRAEAERAAMITLRPSPNRERPDRPGRLEIRARPPRNKSRGLAGGCQTEDPDPPG